MRWMSYIRHDSLFSLQELYQMEQKDRFREIFAMIDTTPILRLVKKTSRYGAGCWSELQIRADLFVQPRFTRYLKSFSKIVFPGLRIGAMVLLEALVETYRKFQRYADTSLLSQAALEIYMNNGMYDWHKNRIAGQYAERIRILNAVLQQHNAQGWVGTPDIRSGIYLQFKIPLTVNLERLIEKLAKKNIRVRSGKPFYLSNYLDREKFLRISVSRARSEQINEGIKGIIEEAKALL